MIPAHENITLWHERDISHSSVERFIAPDSTITIDFALNRLTDVIKNLVLYPKNMTKNLNQLRGLHFSQSVLLALIQEGIDREKAYKIVQSIAMQVWEKKGEFKELLLKNKQVSDTLSKEQVESIFDLKKQLKNISYIYKRVF